MPAPRPRPHRQAPKVYEDAEIKVVIPAGWRIVPREEIDRDGVAGLSLGNSVRGPKGTLLLEKNRYTLAIAYNTGQASGIEGGRFIEIFNIPWPDMDDVWTCSDYFERYVQPASHILTFTNLTVDTGSSAVREDCGIKKDLGGWTEKDGIKTFEPARRWFGGYFTTVGGGFFFDADSGSCGEKAYTLTFQASTPDQLPGVGDPGLKKMIQEAIDVVDSIHYKRCVPGRH